MTVHRRLVATSTIAAGGPYHLITMSPAAATPWHVPQAAQVAAEGPPPPGVSLDSRDSAFGGAQRALQLSALSMPERIAYMQVGAFKGSGFSLHTARASALGAVHA